jgi:PAS domain S-box-containing protein
MSLSRKHLERLTDRSIDIVVATDRKGIVIYYSDGASGSLGYEGDEVVGAFVGRLYPAIEEAKRVMAAMRSPEFGGAGICENLQTTLLSKAGEEIPTAMSAAIIYDDAGEEDGTIGYAKDLREILHKDQLATLGNVAVGLSHEINNPLAVILNQVSLLEGDIRRLCGESDSSVEEERLEAIRREVERITEILERLSEMVSSDQYETVKYADSRSMIDLRKKREDGGPDARLQGLEILVVDDDLGICGTMKELLEGAGCRVQTANDGLQALKLLEEEHFDLMLTDVVMPNMDGHELYLACQKTHPDLPVLMMTAFHYDKDHIIKRSRLKGLDGVIFKKPVDPDRLREVIADTVERHRNKSQG